jgi:hypothetical protein
LAVPNRKHVRHTRHYKKGVKLEKPRQKVKAKEGSTRQERKLKAKAIAKAERRSGKQRPNTGAGCES